MRFVAENAKKLVDQVHAAGKEAMMFLGTPGSVLNPMGSTFPA